METLLLKGKAVSDAIRSSLISRINILKEDDIVPKLAAFIIGEDSASQVYVRNKSRAFEKLNCKTDSKGIERGGLYIFCFAVILVCPIFADRNFSLFQSKHFGLTMDYNLKWLD